MALLKFVIHVNNLVAVFLEGPHLLFLVFRVLFPNFRSKGNSSSKNQFLKVTLNQILSKCFQESLCLIGLEIGEHTGEVLVWRISSYVLSPTNSSSSKNNL